MLGSETTLNLLNDSGLDPETALVNKGTIALSNGGDTEVNTARFVNAGMLTAAASGALEVHTGYDLLNSGTINVVGIGSETAIENGNVENPGSLIIGDGAGFIDFAPATMSSQGNIAVAGGGALEFRNMETFTSSGVLQIDGTLTDTGPASITHLTGNGTVDMEQFARLGFTNSAGEAIGPSLERDSFTRNIAGVGEIVGALGGAEEIEQFADPSPGGLDAAGLGFSHEVLELCEDLLDRVQVGAVGRQEDEVRASGSDGGPRGLALVAAQVVHDDDVAW